jgi:hypothetical protein
LICGWTRAEGQHARLTGPEVWPSGAWRQIPSSGK